MRTATRVHGGMGNARMVGTSATRLPRFDSRTSRVTAPGTVVHEPPGFDDTVGRTHPVRQLAIQPFSEVPFLEIQGVLAVGTIKVSLLLETAKG